MGPGFLRNPECRVLLIDYSLSAQFFNGARLLQPGGTAVGNGATKPLLARLEMVDTGGAAINTSLY